MPGEHLVPTAMDLPLFHAIILVPRSDLGPLGTRGLEDPSFTSMAPEMVVRAPRAAEGIE